MSDKISATVTKTAEVTCEPLHAFLYLDEGKRKFCYQFGEYHDGVLHRKLPMQDAPEELAAPLLEAVHGAMMAGAKAAVASALAKDPADRDPNEAYLAALIEAGNG
jgi:hypothetical protein